MACKNRFPDNTFNFLRFRRINGATLADLPITEDCPIELFVPSPSNLQASAVNDESVDLTWNSAGIVDSYNVYRSTISGNNYVFIGNTLSTSFSDSGLTSDTQYFYIVRALIGLEESSNSNEANATTFFAFFFTTQKQPSVGNIFEPSITYSGLQDPIWTFENGYEFFGPDLSLLNDPTGAINGLNGTAQIVKLAINNKTQISSFESNNDDLVGSLDFSVFIGAVFSEFIIVANSALTIVNLNVINYTDGVIFEITDNPSLTTILMNTSSTAIVAQLYLDGNNLSSFDRGTLIYTNTALDLGQNNLTTVQFTAIDSFIQLDLADNNISIVPPNMENIDYSGSSVLVDLANNSFDPPIPTSISGRIRRLDLRNTGKTGVLDLSGIDFRASGDCELLLTAISVTGLINPDMTLTTAYFSNYSLSSSSWTQPTLDLTTVRIAEGGNRTTFGATNMPLLTNLTRFINVTGVFQNVFIENLGISNIPWSGYDMRLRNFFTFIIRNCANLVNFEFGNQTDLVKGFEITNNPNINKDDTVTFISRLLSIPVVDLFSLNSSVFTTAEVNEILVASDAQFGVTATSPFYNIAGLNSPPDGSSGGFDGLTAIANLVSKGYTVITT